MCEILNFTSNEAFDIDEFLPRLIIIRASPAHGAGEGQAASTSMSKNELLFHA
jgi:hypothetical protein